MFDENPYPPLFRDPILYFRKRSGPMNTQEFYDQMQHVHPDLCDDDYPCTHENLDTPRPEFPHQIRIALAQLKEKGSIVEPDELGGQ